MKTLIIPLAELKGGIFDFNPDKQFIAEWCLDLYGFLTRDGFKERLDKINIHIDNYSLMSEKMKTRLYWLSGILAILVIVIATAVYQASLSNYYMNSFNINNLNDLNNSQPPSYENAIAITTTVEALIGALTFFIKYLIDQKSKELAKNFEKNLKSLLTEYNNQDNPTANWRFVWRSVLSHFNIEINANSDGNFKGKAVPKYVEHAEILLEINDALSNVTAHRVHVNEEIADI
ncbi:tetratricopeptide repeat protein 40 [Gigaspora margarita]|uniref:Tetratricopeptide repeat protein 40 n=1 Tax=Gigaspora margarita TaxID=4874 RepID=A0A8H3WVN5_GIGMA|nr:tetratricopeptide repeat protein 40 [Gigaspora margarita]